MRTARLYILCATAALVAMLGISETHGQVINLTKVDLLDKEDKDLMAFRIKDGEVEIGGQLIKRVTFGKTTATISYFNKTRTSNKPNYKFRLINAYGLEVGHFDAQWTFSSVGLDEARSEEKDIYPTRYDELFQFSTIALPGDWAKPVYLVIEGIRP